MSRARCARAPATTGKPSRSTSKAGPPPTCSPSPSRRHPDVTDTAGLIIWLGADRGHKACVAVAIGVPEEIAEAPEIYTGEWLRHGLGRKGKATAAAPTIAVQRADKANGAGKVNGTP